MKGSVEVVEPKMFAGVVADEIVASISDAISDRGRCSIALAGGRTPAVVYRMLSKPGRVEEVEWSKVALYVGDERWVPTTDDQSNFNMIKEALLQDLRSRKPQAYPVDTSLATPEEGAAAYEALIRKNEGENPSFDIVLLGIGEDGHTASLFPGSELITKPSGGIYRAVKSSDGAGHRVTITPEVLRSAKRIIFIVRGNNKAEVLGRVINGVDSVEVLPARLADACEGKVTFFVDSEAGIRLAKRGV